VAADQNSSGLVNLVAQDAWPAGDDALHVFFDLDSDDVLAIVNSTLKRSPRGRTWQGLHHLMEHKGYARVREMGEEAAVSWARHLGVTVHADAADDSHQQRVRA
jgi:hypothetical protein